MFLATTALDQYWKKDQKILFLGEWCIAHNIDNEKLDYEVLPSLWRDFKTIPEKAYYIYDIFEKLIPVVTGYMNSVNNVNFPEKYWKFLVGPWLLSFVGILYDRYSILKAAVEYTNSIQTIISDNGYVPTTYAEVYNLINGDDYNFIIFSDIIKQLDLPLEIDTASHNIKLDNEEKVKSEFNLKGIVSRIKRNCYTALHDLFSPNDYLQIISTELSFRETVKLLKILNHKKKLTPLIRQNAGNNSTNTAYLNKSRKKSLDAISNPDEFIKLISVMVPMHMPKEYIECYTSNREIANRMSMESPNVQIVMLRCPVEINTGIRFYVAERIHEGAKLISFQHGGGYGTKDYISHEELEIDLCDKYLSWGWKSENKNAKDFFMTKTNWVNRCKYNSNGDILLVGGSCRRYFYNLLEGQVPVYNKIQIDYNKRLIRNIDKNLYSTLLYRFQWKFFSYNEIDEVLNDFPDLRISTRENEGHFYRLFYDSRLVIATTNYTAFLQSFFVNKPTLLLWDPEYFTVRDSAKEYYNLLHDAGILYYSPELCAKKVNEIHQNPMEWWMTAEVQAAKNEYCEHFCRITDNMEGELAEVINEMRERKTERKLNV